MQMLGANPNRVDKPRSIWQATRVLRAAESKGSFVRLAVFGVVSALTGVAHAEVARTHAAVTRDVVEWRAAEPHVAEPHVAESRNVQSRNVQSRNVQSRNVQSRNVQSRNVQPRNVQPRNVQPRVVGETRAASPAQAPAPSPPEASAQSQAPAQAPAEWCAPALRKLTARLCYYSPPPADPAQDTGTLVIFLHSLVSAAPMAAWEQQLRMQRLADTYKFTILIPQGRPGLGPGRDPNVLAWPTAQELQAQHEAELLAEWRAGITQAQELHGAFARVFLIGFSNGAYYATSLTFRECVAVDGVAVFAGGSGAKYQRLTASRAKRRIPMFVGYGTLDPDNRQQRALVSLLKALGWPHRALAAKVGHTVASEQMRAALRFLGHPGVKAR